MQTKFSPKSMTRVGLLLAIVGAVFPMAANASANDTSPQEVTVIAHLPLSGATVSEMSLQQENGRQYLYIRQGREQGFTVIDVTKPAKPAITKRDALPNTAAKGNLEVFRDGLAIAETPDTPSPAQSSAKLQGVASAAHPQSVRVLDLSDPAHPRTLKTFDGVTSVVPDNGRNLIYLTNGEGLWVLRHRRPAPHPVCDSESAFLPLANCYAY